MSGSISCSCRILEVEPANAQRLDRNFGRGHMEEAEAGGLDEDMQHIALRHQFFSHIT